MTELGSPLSRAQRGFKVAFLDWKHGLSVGPSRGFLGVICLGHYSTSNILFPRRSDQKDFSFQPRQKKKKKVAGGGYASPDPRLTAFLGTTCKLRHLCSKTLGTLSFWLLRSYFNKTLHPNANALFIRKDLDPMQSKYKQQSYSNKLYKSVFSSICFPCA